MSKEQLIAEAMELPLPERVSLAQLLWQSINEGLAESVGGNSVEDAIVRDEELSSGAVKGRSHDDVMRAARRAIGCD
jgi:hypothetical protein